MCAGAAVEPLGRDAESALERLRRARRTARLGRLEWFEVAYRAYLVVLVGGALVVALTGWIPADPVTVSTLQAVRHRGADVVALVAVIILAIGARSGVNGGPIAVESPDVRFVLLAPVRRRAALLRPCVQRLSTLAVVGGAAGGVAGLLAAPRLGGSTPTWTVVGAVTGAALGCGAGALAVLTHATKAPAAVVRTATTIVVAGQTAAVVWKVPGVASPLGEAVLWPLTRRSSSFLIGAGTVAMVAVLTSWALAWCGRLRPEALERRTSLVAQLRFALAVGDLRTVMLLRRQLTHDQLRSRPWFVVRPPRRTPRRPSHVLWWRSAVSLARLPLQRLARLLGSTVVTGAAAAAVVDGTAALLIVVALGTFLIGLELTEALAQTVDHMELRQLVPQDPRSLLPGMVVVPAVATLPLTVLAVAAAALVSASATAWLVGAVIGVPLMWAGAAGAVVNVVRAAPDPMARAARAMSMPPEVAGLTTVVQAAWPFMVSMLGVMPLWFVADAVEQGGSPVAAAVRGAVAALLVAGTVVTWLRSRDDVRRRWRTLVAAGDEARRQAALARRTRTGDAP